MKRPRSSEAPVESRESPSVRIDTDQEASNSDDADLEESDGEDLGEEVKNPDLATDFMGIEGCVSIALCNTKILGMDESTITGVLDEELIGGLAQFRQLFPDPSIVPGIAGYTWNAVIIRSMVEKHSRFTLVKMSMENGGCAALLSNDRRDMFIVDGYLNRGYSHIRRHGRAHRLFHKTNEDGDPDPESWRHTVAIRNGRVFCKGVHASGIAVQNLWLNGNGQPDVDRGYMHSIRAVYRLDVLLSYAL